MRRPRRRIALAATLAASTAASIAIAAPASAAVTPTCGYNPGHILAVGSGTADKGFLYDYPYTGTVSDTSAGTFGARVKIGTSWNGFGVIRAGADGVIFAATPAGAMYYYKWKVGTTTFDKGATLTPVPAGLSAPWAGYTTTAGKKKIAVDSRNQIYLLDSSNRILKYSFDISTAKWTTWALPVAQLTGSFDMIWATGAGVLMARRTDGTAQRIRIDETADRALITEGPGLWSSFPHVFSLGADTNLPIAGTDGRLQKYRYDEDTKLFSKGVTIGTGWGAFLNVTGVVNTCSRTYTAPTATREPEVGTPIEALGTTNNTIYLAYADGPGRLEFAQTTGESAKPLSWVQSNGSDGITGRPALIMQNDGLVHAYSHVGASGVIKEQTEVKAGTDPSTLGPGAYQKGVLTGHPDAAIIPGGTNVLAATDAAGAIWVRQQYAYGAPLQNTPWRRLGTGAAASADVTVQASVVGQVAVYATSATGGVLTSAVPTSGFLAAPSDLGVPGTGATGSIGAMSYPGGAQRIVVADTNGQVWTKAQSLSGRVWETSWTAVDLGHAIKGSPSVVLSPISGRVQIVARDSTDVAVISSESGQSTRAFGPFTSPTTDSVPLATSPTVFEYTDSTRPTPVLRWGIVGYDANLNVWAWTSQAPLTNGALQRGTGADAQAADGMKLSNLGALPR